VQQVLPGLEVGVDAYYKKATNLIDDGQFGAAYVLTAFNYAQGENVGVELSAELAVVDQVGGLLVVGAKD
jgi:hypothetical protein